MSDACRRRRNHRVGIVMVLTLAMCAASSVPASATTQITESGITGGGFANNVVLDPNNPTRLLTAGDVWGVHRSGNSATNWITNNEDMTDQLQLTIASVTYSATNSGVAYAGWGEPCVQHRGGLMKGVPGATGQLEWSQKSSQVVFAGQSGACEGPMLADGTEVRSTGNLIALHETGPGTPAEIYAGTFRDGVYRSTNDGVNWTLIALAPGSSACSYTYGGNSYSNCWIRTLVSDPTDPTTLYVGTYGAGLFRIDHADSCASPCAPVKLSTMTVVEELAFDTTAPSHVLWCACGKTGMARSTAYPYTSWNLSNSGIDLGGPEWSTVAVAPLGGGGADVYAGAVNPAAEGNGMYRTIKRLPSGGSSWNNVTVIDASISRNICPTSTRWWMADVDSGNRLLGHSLFKPGMLAATGTTVFVAGNTGVWRSLDSGGTWCPAVQGLGISVPKDAETSPAPGDAARIYTAITDWTFVSSADHGSTVAQNVTGGAGGYGLALAVDAWDASAPADVYLGVGVGGPNIGGEVYRSADPQSGTWDSLGLNVVTSNTNNCPDAPGGRVIGVAVGRNGSNIATTIAGVTGCGIWQKVGTGQWNKVLSEAFALANPPTYGAPMAWPKTSTTPKYVYVLDRNTNKIWFSNSYGDLGSWNQVANWPMLGHTDKAVHLAADARVLGRLWITTEDQLGTYRGDNTHLVTASFQQYNSGNVPNYPGPVAVNTATNPSTIYVASGVAIGSTVDPKVWSTVNSGTTWTWVDSDLYRGAALYPRTAAYADGRLYIGTGGNGMLVVDFTA